MLDFKQSLRSLAKAPGFTALVIAVLAIGIGANAAMFTLIDRLLLHPLPYRGVGRLVEIKGRNSKGRPSGISYAAFDAWKDRVPAFEGAAISKWRDLMLTGVDDPENLLGLEVSRKTFDLLGVPPLLGRLFRDDDFASGAPRTIILDYRVWQKHFRGDPQVIGRQMMLDGEGYHVIGVMPADFTFTSPLFKVWTPLEHFKDAAGELHHSFSGIARLRPGATIGEAQRLFDGIAATLPVDPQDHDGWKEELQPYIEQFVGEQRRSLYILWAAVCAVLLIACANAANLLLARASTRRREYAVRASLGAGQLRLVRQILSESLVLGVAAGVVGGLLAAALLPLVARFLPKVGLMPGERLTITPAAIGVTVAAALLTALLCAVPTCIDVLRSNLLSMMGGASRSVSANRASARLRSVLIAVEVALSIVLLIGAGLMIRSLSRLLDVRRLGLETSHVLTAKVSAPAQMKKVPEVAQYYQRVLDGVRQVPGVRAASIVTILPFSNLMVSTSFTAEGARETNWREYPINLRSVSADYFKALGVRLLRGRAFTDADGPDAPDVAIINQELANHCWPGEDPIGRRVTRAEDPSPKGWYTVVGVVENTARAEISKSSQAELYRPYTQDATAARATSLVVRTAVDPLALGPAIGRQVHAINPDQPVTDIKTMETWINQAASRPRLQTFLLELFAALALVLATSGVFAVVSYMVSQRTQEIGIRTALGATAGNIVGFVLKMGLRPVLAGATIGVAASLGLVRLLRAELFETPPSDPVVYAAVVGILLSAALAAMWLPARRAAGIQPALTLRE